MARYNLESLSSQDFEELIRDLLQAEWEVALEAFRSGRDQGIDLRYAPAHGGATIIQCKHYAGSGFAKLLANLRNRELPKIRHLSPSRYVVATSVSLTPSNKDQIVAALQPFVLDVRDVLGANDIEGLLSRHPEVERANFKLWLTSTSVLERVLHNATLCQTDFEVDRIRRKLPLFVKSDAYPRATEILNQTRIVVVTGPPGIGKTTLAEMLLYAHLEDGYEPIVIEADIDKARSLFKAACRQVFYYDDFLGQVFLGDRREYLGRNQDMGLVNFMEMVRQSPQSRFILTTREHILSGALQVSERLAQSSILEHRCILVLSDYSHSQRARLLYNHLYFSDLPPEYKEEVLRDDFFLSIIKHEHFNPRLVEWLSSYSRLKKVPVQGYRAYVSALLQVPEVIWAHAFHHQISNAARHVLLIFETLGDGTRTADLEPAFIALHHHNADKYHAQIQAGDFRRALQELEGAFLSYNKGRVNYLNPSVREFVASVITEQTEIAEDLVSSAVRFKQIMKLWELAAARPESRLRILLATNASLLSRPLARLLKRPSMRWEKMGDIQAGYSIDVCYEGRIGFLAELATFYKSSEFARMATELTENLSGEWREQFVDFDTVLPLLTMIAENQWFLDNGGREVYRSLLSGVLEELDVARADDWLALLEFSAKAPEWSDSDESQLTVALRHYEKSGARDERYDCSSVDELRALQESFERLHNEYGLDLEFQIERLYEEISENEERAQYREGSGYSRAQTPGGYDLVTDDEVREMFRSLRQDF